MNPRSNTNSHHIENSSSSSSSSTASLNRNNIPSGPCPSNTEWSKLILLLKQLPALEKDARLKLSKKIQQTQSFAWLYTHYQTEMRRARVLQIYRLLISSRSPFLMDQLSRNSELLAFIAKTLLNSSANKALSPRNLVNKTIRYLHALIKNNGAKLAVFRICTIFIKNWNENPIFNNKKQEIFEKLSRKLVKTGLNNVVHLTTLHELFFKVQTFPHITVAPIQSNETPEAQIAIIPSVSQQEENPPAAEDYSDLNLLFSNTDQLVAAHESSPLSFHSIFKRPESHMAMLNLNELDAHEDGLAPLKKLKI